MGTATEKQRELDLSSKSRGGGVVLSSARLSLHASPPQGTVIHFSFRSSVSGLLGSQCSFLWRAPTVETFDGEQNESAPSGASLRLCIVEAFI